MTMAMELIRHIAGLYSGQAFKGDLTQIYITGNEIWMAQQILASQQVEGAQGERETFEAVYSSLDLSMWDDAWGMPAYRHSHVDALWEGWQARAALAQPSPKCATCNDRGHVCLDWEAGAWDECPDCKAQEPQNCPTFMGEPIAQPYEAPRDKINALFKALGFSGTASVGDILDAAIERVQAQPSPSVVQLSGSRERRIYVAGPMTGYKDFNFPAFNAQAEALRGLGYHVENPAEHGIVDGAEWQDYLRYDIGRLSTCEAIFLLPGWSKSKGAALEVHIAKALGMTFIHHADAEHEQPSPAPELERPEVVAWLVTGVHPNHSAPHVAVDRNGQNARGLADHWAERGCAVEIMPLVTVAQHERILRKALGDA